MARGLHGQGFMGIAFEPTYGTYVAPSEYFPIRSESLQYMQDTYFRRVIRGIVDIVPPAIQGYSHVEGEIEMDLMENVLPYFLRVGRWDVVESGSTPNFIYTCTPTHIAGNDGLPSTSEGLSITIVRAGVTFGYVGCLLGGLEISVDNGIPIMRFIIVGSDETTQSLPTATFQTGVGDTPFGAGQYDIQVPTASQIFDVENFVFTANDNAEPQYRLNDSTRARFVKFGEREMSMEFTRDFDGRTEYDTFKALTATSITIECSKGVNNGVAITLPTAVRETYELDGLSEQGELHMATVRFNGIYDTATSRAAQIVINCQEDLPV